jgi:hypothetical protein
VTSMLQLGEHVEMGIASFEALCFRT